MKALVFPLVVLSSLIASSLLKAEPSVTAIEVHDLGARERARGWNLPPPLERDSLLQEAGLAEKVTEWDELERDLLALRAREYSRERLVRAYPRLPAKELEKLWLLEHAGARESR